MSKSEQRGRVGPSGKAGAALPEDGARLEAGGRETGEITSSALSPTLGPIALGYVRREHAEPGTELALAVGSARVVELPFVSGARAVEGAEPDGT